MSKWHRHFTYNGVFYKPSYVFFISSASPSLSGLSLKEAKLPEKMGLHIIAIKKRGESFYTYNPSSKVKIERGDTAVALGYWDQIDEMRKLAGAG